LHVPVELPKHPVHCAEPADEDEVVVVVVVVVVVAGFDGTVVVVVVVVVVAAVESGLPQAVVPDQHVLEPGMKSKQAPLAALHVPDEPPTQPVHCPPVGGGACVDEPGWGTVVVVVGPAVVLGPAMVGATLPPSKIATSATRA
jgi:hypothetical protein